MDKAADTEYGHPLVETAKRILHTNYDTIETADFVQNADRTVDETVPDTTLSTPIHRDACRRSGNLDPFRLKRIKTDIDFYDVG